MSETSSLLNDQSSIYRKRSVAIIGFGYVGTVLGVFLAERGFKVLGIDNQSRIIQKITSGQAHLNERSVSASLVRLVSSGQICVTDSYEQIGNSEIIIVTVGTPIDNYYSADISALKSCISAIGGFLKKGSLLILKSTFPPGTTRTVVGPMLRSLGLEPGKDIFLSFCPERLAEGNAMNEIMHIPVVVSGIDEMSALQAEQFWKNVGLEVIRVNSLEAAELTKLADNVWIDTNIALANEIARVCEATGINAMEVIRAANSLPKGEGRVNFLTPGVGVGGSCLTKDPWFLVDFASSKGVKIEIPQVARQVNDKVPSLVVETVVSALKRGGMQPDRAKIAILGYAFKGSTDDTRNTPAKPIVKELAGRGFDVSIFDPWVNNQTIVDECGVVPSTTAKECLREADALMILANHPEFNALDLISDSTLKKHSIIYDGWHILDPRELVRRLGHEYYSPGNFLGMQEH